MTTIPTYAITDESESVPFEAIPALAANEHYLAGMERLRELKSLKDKLFNDDEKKGPLGEYEGLKREMAAMQLVHGQKSVTYVDLRVASVSGGVTKGKVTGKGLADWINAQPNYGTLLAKLHENIHVLIAAAESFDPAKLLEAGLPADLINSARTPDKPRASSIRVEWVGAKGRGADKKMRGTGGAGGVQ